MAATRQFDCSHVLFRLGMAAANALPRELQRCLEVGMNGYLSKPYRPQDLLVEIERVLVARARAHPNIDLYEDHCGVDLLTARKAGDPGPDRVLGAYVLEAGTGVVQRFLARVTGRMAPFRSHAQCVDAHSPCVCPW